MKYIVSLLLHIYTLALLVSIQISVALTAGIFTLFSKVIMFILGKKNIVLVLFPFDNYKDWKEYLAIIKSFLKQTSFTKTFSLLYYKFRTNKTSIQDALPYFKFPEIETKSCFYTINDYPALTGMLENQHIILNEYAHATKYLKQYVDEVGNAHEDWQTIFLYVNGQLNEKVKNDFPKTLCLLNHIEGLDRSMILFSVLKPNAVIPPHTGPFNAFLKVHLPLVIPIQNDKCIINVGAETSFWENNKLLIFDDSFLHSVKNNSNETRVVLLFAIEKKEIKKEVSILVQQFINKMNDSILFKQWMYNNI